ncbi:MAG: conjugal transfer protein [Candidatus Nanopelagicales bacterium]
MKISSLSKVKGLSASKLKVRVPAPLSKPPQWSGGQEWMTKAVRWAIIGALVCGVIAFAVMVAGVVSPASPMSKTKQAESVNTVEQAAAGDLAEQFVLTWLQAKRGEEKSLAPFVRSESLRLPIEQSYIANDARVVRIEAVPVPQQKQGGSTSSPAPPARSYSVTVAVLVRSAKDTADAVTRRYFAVSVVFVDGAARAAALPAPVAAPVPGPDVDLGYQFRVTTNHPVTTSTQQFLSALVAGGGEISRYVSPGTTMIRGIVPPPYTAVKILDLVSDVDLTGFAATPADGQVVRVLATAELVVTGTDSVTGQYALTLTARGGRWEVSGMDAAPLMPAPQPAESVSSPQPSGASRTTSPTTSTVGATTTTAAPASSAPAN